MLIAEQDCRHIVDNMCIAILENPTSPAVAFTEPLQAEDGLGGYVQITGAWEGAVALWCPWALLHQAASHMFGSETTSDEDRRDALCEMTNMIGGSVKALLPEPCTLSLPNTTEALATTCRDGGWQEIQSVTYQCNGHRFSVALWQLQTQATVKGVR